MSLAPANLHRAPISEQAPDPVDVPLDGMEPDPKGEALRIEFDDGSVSINLGGMVRKDDADSSDHDANLALSLADDVLGSIADDLLRKIANDEQRQQERLEEIAEGITLLGIKLEKPRTEPNEEGLSVVRNPLLLEAVLRFQAQARGELLPADGPVKMRDDDETNTTQEDDEANKLALDFNHYLTAVDVEYYPDTDRMLFSLGFGGEAYKKVYFDPIRKRPVSRTVDRKDIILSDGAVCIESCPRVTHRFPIFPSHMRRMQLAGAWRDVGMAGSMPAQPTEIDLTLADVSGIQPRNSIEQDEDPKTGYECYCELDLAGFEHTEKGEKTGLPLPYRVTLCKETRQVLEIRRWWEEDDEAYLRREVFVEYIFVPAFPGVNLGLLHILGNGSRALTAAWRIALDNGMLANFPGGLIARGSGRQQTTNIRMAPGQAAPVDTDGLPINQAFAQLPYRDVTPGFVSIIQNIEQTLQRVGGTAETATGEGNQQAPVGTTLALIEQATMVLNAVHKRCHQSQSKEFMLLKKLFAQVPEALYIQTDDPALPKDEATVKAALENNNLVPAADPNTSSQTHRIQKAIAIRTLASQNPANYDQVAVDRRIMNMIGIPDPDELFAKVAPQTQPPDPAKMASAQAAQTAAQAKMIEATTKAKTAVVDNQLQAQDNQIRAQDVQTDAINRADDRQANLQIEQLRLRREEIIHQQGLQSEHALQDKQHAHERDMHLGELAAQNAQNSNEKPKKQ